jgi:hypothetical protein
VVQEKIIALRRQRFTGQQIAREETARIGARLASLA